MKKVLCVIDSLESGGAQRQLVQLAIQLKRKTYEVELLCWHKGGQDGEIFAGEMLKHGVGFKCLDKLRNKYLRINYLNSYVKRWRPDVVISYYPGASMMLAIGHVFHKTYKLIVSERSMTRHISFRVRLKYNLYRFADMIVPNSHQEGQFIASHFSCLGKKVHVINNYIDTNRFSPSCNKGFEQIQAVFVGRFTEAKNIPRLLQALKCVYDTGRYFQIDFYGNSNQKDYRDACDTLVSQLEIGQFVHFYDATSDIENKYRSHNLFILSSVFEGFPNVLCEAMSSGLPVLCSNVSDIPYIMKDGINGFLFNPLSVDDIASKIIEFYDLPIERKVEMSYQSRKLAEEKFGGKDFVDKYIALF